MMTMKNLNYSIRAILFTSLILQSCVSDQNNAENDQDSAIVIDSAAIRDTMSDSGVDLTPPALPYVVVFNEESGRFDIVENPDDQNFTPNGEGYVEALNIKYPEISIRQGERHLDTLNVFIDNATYLTQSIGSAGANSYLAEATYAFTELDSVNVVNFNFQTGDHATSGPYTRAFFKDFH